MMMSSKPYLVIYASTDNTLPANIKQTDFQIDFFKEKTFSKALINKINANSNDTQAIVIVNAQTILPLYWFERLSQVLAEKTQVQICSALTSKKNSLSPLVAGDEFIGNVTELDNLIYLQQAAETIYTDDINHDCFIVRNKKYLATQNTPFYACNNLFAQQLGTQGDKQTIKLTDIQDISNQKPLPAHPLAQLQWQLKSYLSEQQHICGYPWLDKKPIMLHICMDWGGGVHKWINDFCQQQTTHQHLILASKGELYRHRHGEQLVLHYAQTNGVIMQNFELQAPIQTTCSTHPEYQQILTTVIKQFQIQQIIVSSLIGHSLQCLQTGVPTIRVLHDYFPSWPSLLANLDKPTLSQEDVKQALKQSKKEPFGEISLTQYEHWKNSLHNAYQKHNVKLVAPSLSVVENLTKIDDKAFNYVTIIPHAIAKFPPLEYTSNISMFQVLILGRINPPKGQKLLEEIMQGLGEDYVFIMIGAGNEGKKYLKVRNIAVIMDYDNDNLQQLLQETEPNIALITSQTSETFNYTLSELQQAGICTVSTKYGALKDRIIHGQTGFLCDDNVSDIVNRIQNLRNNPKKIIHVRENLKNLKLSDFKGAIEQYNKLCSDQQPSKYKLQIQTSSNALAKVLLSTNKEKLRISKLLLTSEAQVEDRTSWAQNLTKELQIAEQNIQQEQKEAKQLKQIIAQERIVQRKESKRMMAELASTQQAFSQVQTSYEQTHKQLQQAQLRKKQVAQELSLVYQSRSWRITKPMRKFTTWARHKRNALKFRLTQLKIFPARTIRSLKTRGLTSTVGVIKGKFTKNKASTTEIKKIELSQDYTKIILNKIKNPQVSIIIPVYNHFQHSYNCLKSIAALQEQTTFEVIVVDDCSTDNTQELINNIAGITYHRQQQNGGFIESCNTGAKLATGQYLMFLNNDTVVHANWLDALLAVFINYADAGLAGSKLIYPDNQLQEAGGIVFSDASGWNYGRLGNPDEPQYNHVREVDYCSGASILISKDLFAELGYFDERYKPAYYEDTDLAFAVRDIGKKVYYQPASKVTHFEGVSAGTDLTQGMKKYQLVNQVKFKEKWIKALSNQANNGAEIELCRIHGQPKRILIVDACTPTPDQDSGSLRMLNLIKILTELNYHVIFMTENLSYNDNYTQDLQQLGVECIYSPSITNPVDYLKTKGKFLDVVMLSRYYVAEPVMSFIRKYCPTAQIIFDTVDLHYVRERRMAELSHDKKLTKMAEITRKKELAIAKACDVTLVVSPYEVEVLAKELPDLKVKILTNIHAIYGCRKSFQQRKDIMFIGGYQHTPNVDAVQWFVKDIFPLIAKELPDLKFHIIGSRAPKHIQAMARENIIFQGFVADIEPVMDDIRIAVAPLRYGAGVKGKVNMSMSYGQPVVGTKVAVEGMFTVDEKDCLMAETPKEFAQQVIRLYQDEQLWNKISKGGLENVENYFSFNAAKKAIVAVLNT